jgi:hypothetical protein
LKVVRAASLLHLLLSPRKMSSTLLNLEANYELGVRRYDASPSPARRTELAMKQILIDGVRHEEKKPLRWFTAEEIEKLGDEAETWKEKGYTEPREPLGLVQDVSEMAPEAWKELPKMVNWHSYTTLSLDSLIAMLQEMRETHGGQMPVMGVEFGGFSSLSRVEKDDEGCIVIE